MCDYSLMGLPSRLAVEREELVVHRFSTGTVGLASPGDLTTMPINRVPAVCIAPGAHLLLQDIPPFLQRTLGVQDTEPVTFTQITAKTNSHRDAFRFANGREILLQELIGGQRVWVLDIPSGDNPRPDPAEAERERVFAGMF